MNVLVTGATGFIGGTLVDRLLKNNDKVIILTRDIKKVNSLVKDRVKILEVDLTDIRLLKNLTAKLHDIDIVFHLAASLDYYAEKNALFPVNVEATINLLKLTRDLGVKRFIFTSSIEAMGPIEKKDMPADEEYIPRPVSPYGESKLEAEEQIKKFAEENNINITILRLGNIYGSGSSDFILSIAEAVFKRNKLFRFLSVYKDYYLHLGYIDDIVEGLIRVASTTEAKGIYILSGENCVTIGILFELISKALNIDINLQNKKRSLRDVLYLSLRKKIYRFLKKADLITYFTAGVGERVHRAYSIEKAKKELNFYPKVNLQEGITRTVNWARQKGLL
ncbi:MAG: NAD(P)-dependent oxidoreductase [Candidatus Omnitrophica bacterium]|nr:NAD(P)-dependent oxidoreductase [Candidatus Omnitrophota bacterium]